ncbi:hypothetical protein Tco_0656030 [Tanacetum coccineum]|uniref:Uncharacterized protein n=1 Tax=Tanacetum coccineum TaxID=301880 RepID=A0ABQ4X8V1_9ASTR
MVMKMMLSDADDDKEASNSEKTDSNEDENINLNQNDDEEEENKEEYIRTPDSFEFNDDDEEYEELYKDVNVRLTYTEHEEQGKEDEEITDVDHDDSTQQTKYEQVKDDKHVTLTTVHDTQKTKGPMQSSPVTSDFANQFPNLDNAPPTDSEVVSMMNVKVRREEPTNYSAQLLEMIKSQIPAMVGAQLSTRLEDSMKKYFRSYTIEFEKKAKDERKRYIDLVEKSMKDIIKDELDKDLFESYGKVYSLKRDREDKDKDEDPPARLDQRLKKQKTSKDVEPLRGSKSKESKSSSSKGSKSQLKSSGKSAQAEQPVFEITDTEIPLNQGEELECYKAVTDRLDWTNPEGYEYPFDLSKPIPLIENQGSQVVLANYFINNDLKYLKGGSSSRKYTTSTTKTIAAKYDTIEGIEDMVPSLWSPVKSKHDVFSTKRIIAVTYVKVMKWYDYGYLEEIIVRRKDQQLYKFKEVKKKLSNLEKDVIFDLNVALRIFTRRVVILKRMKYLQLGVESYQKKLNITRPETFRSDITKMTPYTAYKNPQIIYQDKFQRNRLMRSDEIYKLCDGTLSSIQKVLPDIASSLEMDYLPKRRWSKLDRKRSRIMIKAIDQQLFERRLMRNLEKFVGGREYGEDFRLL